jgi:hypothetical protein
MAPLPHASPRLLVGVGSLLVAVGAVRVTRAVTAAPHDLRSWPRRVLARFRTDLERGGPAVRAWLLVLSWGALVTVLHFGGLFFGVYSRLFWWDLLTHAMGGAGVAGILFLGLGDRTTTGTPWWLVGSVAAIGAGFEVYEFLFKSFWYRWSLQFYAVDTAVDIVVNTLGAVAFVVVLGTWRRQESRTSQAEKRL